MSRFWSAAGWLAVILTAGQTEAQPRAAEPLGAQRFEWGDQQNQWWQFRGPLGRGVLSNATGLPVSLDPVHQQWRVEIPPGHSSPIIVGQRVFITAYADQAFLTLCFDLATGRELWRQAEQATAVEKTHPQHGPASCTPVSDGERVVVVFGSLGARCFDLDGNRVWQIDRPVQKNLFGSAASPVIYDGRLLLFFASEEKSELLSVEPLTGNIIWSKEKPGPASSWSTPVVWESGQGRQILYYEPFHLRAVAWDGTDLWSVPGLADEPITVPQVLGDLVFTTSYNLRTNQEAQGLPEFAQLLKECDGNGDGRINAEEARKNSSILSRPDADGQGDHPLRMFFRLLDENQDGQVVEAEWPRIRLWMDPWNHANGLIAIRPGQPQEPATLAWTHAEGVPECPTPVLIGDKILLIRNGGVVTCVAAESGQTLFQERQASGGPYYASPVAGDGKVYLASARGVITVLDVNQFPPLKLHEQELGEPVFATPALHQSGIVIRTDSALMYYKK